MSVEYRINMLRIPRDVRDGAFVLVGLDGYQGIGKDRVRNTAIGRIVRTEDGKTELDLPEIGRVRAAWPGYGTTSLDLSHSQRELTAYASSKLATENADLARAYLERLRRKSPAKAVVYHVESVEGGEISGRLITESTRHADVRPTTLSATAQDIGNLAFTQIGAADVTDPFPAAFDAPAGIQLSGAERPAVGVGDIVVAGNFSFDLSEGSTRVRLSDSAVIGNADTIGKAVAYLGMSELPPTPRHGFAHSLSDASVLDWEFGDAVARTEPDSALVLWYPSASDPEKTEVAVLGASGHHAYVNDDIGDYMSDMTFSPGLYVVNDLSVRGWQASDGEWDAELQGEWSAATAQDVERLFGGDIDAEIAQIAEVAPEKGIGELYMAFARQSIFDEKFEVEHRKFVAHRFGVIDATQYFSGFPEEDVVNLHELEDFLDHAFQSVAPDALRLQIRTAFRRNALSRTGLFHPVAATEAEMEEVLAKKTWRPAASRKPAVFLANRALKSDVRTVVAFAQAHRDALSDRIDKGQNINAGRIDRLMSQLERYTVPQAALLFADAPRTKGEWRLVGKKGKEVSLALSLDGDHVVTLITSGDRSRILSASGLELTSPNIELASHRYVAADDVLLDADRAVCELEARRLSTLDDLVRPQDGVYRNGGITAYVANGVLHREGGPAVFKSARGNGADYQEYRFRGNLHRDGGPAIVMGDEFVWYRHGLEHRVDGPSTSLSDTTEYRMFDRLHRVGLPAVLSPGIELFYLNGIAHRDDGPALSYPTKREYRRAGQLHRIGGAAVEEDGGCQSHYVNGRLHNEDGPAHSSPDGDIYAVDGVVMTETEFGTRMRFVQPVIAPSA